MGIVYKVLGVTLYGFCILWALIELILFHINKKKKPIINAFNPIQYNPANPNEKVLRKVSDITTKMLREERRSMAAAVPSLG